MQKLVVVIASVLFCISAVSGKLPEPEPIPEPTPMVAVNRITYWEEHPEECPFERLSQIAALTELADSAVPNGDAIAKEAIMQCAINRSKTAGFPNTIEEVCSQPNQWPVTNAPLTSETRTIATNLIDKQDTIYIAVIPINCVYMSKTDNGLEFSAEWNGETTFIPYDGGNELCSK